MKTWRDGPEVKAKLWRRRRTLSRGKRFCWAVLQVRLRLKLSWPALVGLLHLQRQNKLNQSKRGRQKLIKMDAKKPVTLQTERHIKYWKRCHSSYLPAPYVAADSTRLTLACFIISALDLLRSPLSTDERRSIRRWVLSLQHPDGGFCGSSTHAHDGAQADKGTANLAATYFALVLLALAAGDTEDQQRMAFYGVKRKKLLMWLRRLQSTNGSFGQIVWDGDPAGGDDVRHGYMAAGIRWMLRGEVKEGENQWVDDIDVDALRRTVVNAQTYDGGIGESMGLHESHGE